MVLLNDDEHTYGHVTDMVQRLLGFSPEEAFLIAQEVNRAGRSVVCIVPLAWAEQVKGQIESFGSDTIPPCCRGSMRVAPEPAG